MSFNVLHYFCTADLPAFFLTTSFLNLIPFPLYGSGFLNDLIFEAT